MQRKKLRDFVFKKRRLKLLVLLLKRRKRGFVWNRKKLSVRE